MRTYKGNGKCFIWYYFRCNWLELRRCRSGSRWQRMDWRLSKRASKRCICECVRECMHARAFAEPTKWNRDEERLLVVDKISLFFFCSHETAPNWKQNFKICTNSYKLFNLFHSFYLFLTLQFLVYRCSALVHTCTRSLHRHTNATSQPTQCQSQPCIDCVCVSVRKTLCKWKYLLWFGCITRNFCFIFNFFSHFAFSISSVEW